MKKIWADTAPSNIALIKYMGKKEGTGNLPDNPSLSYTLPHLKTKVEIESGDYPEDMWEPLVEEGYTTPNLAPKESQRFLDHFQTIKSHFNIEDNFLIRSANNFPQDCGLASSASSFAALTKCSVKSFTELKNLEAPTLDEVASLSRKGSGSSCRSFMEPWCMWSEERILKVNFSYTKLLHMVVVSDDSKKKVSSSLAHKKVSTSMLYQGRTERAITRMGLLIEALNLKNWSKAFELCWAEFWDMHALFETSDPSFGYFTKGSLDILNQSKSIWTKIGDGPLITMDAGPNVHLLFRPEQLPMAESLKTKFENCNYRVFSSGI